MFKTVNTQLLVHTLALCIHWSSSHAQQAYSSLVRYTLLPNKYLATRGLFLEAASFSGFFIRLTAILRGIGGAGSLLARYSNRFLLTSV